MKPNKETALKVSRELLNGKSITIVDVGARNKTWELPGIASLCDVYGFEPNVVEYDKMIVNKTDLELVVKDLKDLPYRSIQYIDKALSNREGTSAFNITRGPGACSLLEPNTDMITQMEYYTPRTKKFPPQFEIEKKQITQVTTLDKVAEFTKIDSIDYLKLDTQGNELDILHGAKNLFSENRVGVIKSEVEFQELYKHQGFFSDIDAFLRSQGFTLLNIEFDARHRVIWSKERIRWDKGTLLFGDAYYALSLQTHSNLSETQVIRHALVLSELGFIDYAIALLNRAKSMPSESRDFLISYWKADNRTWKRKIKHWLERRFFNG